MKNCVHSRFLVDKFKHLPPALSYGDGGSLTGVGNTVLQGTASIKLSCQAAITTAKQ